MSRLTASSQAPAAERLVAHLPAVAVRTVEDRHAVEFAKARLVW